MVLCLLLQSLTVREPWFPAARAKHASLVSNSMALFAAATYAPEVTVRDAEAQLEYQPLMREGAASSWCSMDGFLGKPEVDDRTVRFADQSYKAMRDDESRTPQFAKAIKARLAEAPPNTLAVLDIGTGPLAVLALLAADSGARKVYAIEVNADAAERARETVRDAGWADVIEVFTGYSTAVTLPEQVDVVVSEIVGSVASEEGMYATVHDAHVRGLVKEPTRRDSWIPHRVETWGAPCSYALQHALGAPAYDWGGIDEPLRLSCPEATLLMLATPQRVEDVSFTDPLAGHVALEPLEGGSDAAPTGPPPVDCVFEVTSDRLEANERAYEKGLLAQGIPPDAARDAARGAARGLSGFALWPRLILRDGGPRAGGEGFEEEVVVESRDTAGAANLLGTSWQTVVPLLAERPVTVVAGQIVRTRTTVELPSLSEKPIWYSLEYN
eukprot:5303992-Prymnesium_polylepis.1